MATVTDPSHDLPRGPASALRVLVVSPYYPPEKTGCASRVSDLCEKMTAVGAKITVLAPHPTFPTGAHPRVWRWRRARRDGSVEVINLWAWQPASRDPGFASRVAYYLTFPLHAALWALFNPRAYDIILCTMPPVFTGLAGLIATAVHRKKRLVIDVRDLWVDAAVGLGFVKEDSLFTKWTRGLERAALRRADLVTVVTARLGDKLARRHPEVAGRVVVASNGVDTEKFRPHGGTKLPQFVYAGLLGHAQDIDVMLDAFARIGPGARGVKFVLVGDGERRPALEERARALGITAHVEFRGAIPRSEVPALLSGSIVGIAPVRDLESLDYAVPTKAYEYLACGIPVLGTGGGEFARLVAQSEGGRVVNADAAEIARTMEWFLDHPDEARTMGERGRAHVLAEFDRRVVANKVIDAMHGFTVPIQAPPTVVEVTP